MYRIYTEDVNRPTIDKIVSAEFPSYTELTATGVWNGQREPSLVVELETQDGSAVEQVAAEIKAANHQEAVLVTHTEDQANLV